MFELPELMVIAEQFSQCLKGKTIRYADLGNSPHKFVWYNRKAEEFDVLASGKKIGNSRIKGRWLLLAFDPGYTFVFGEMGGQIRYHGPEEPIPAKYHLLLQFTDGSALTVFIRMWGALELYENGEELKRQYIENQAPSPMEAAFSVQYFTDLVLHLKGEGKLSVKGLLTQHQIIPGLGNSIAQDIMFACGLHPKRDISTLSPDQVRHLHSTIVGTVAEIASKGGRYDETDIFGQAGKYIRRMDAKAAGKPCPVCKTTIMKIQYLGGSCYFCVKCQSES